MCFGGTGLYKIISSLLYHVSDMYLPCITFSQPFTVPVHHLGSLGSAERSAGPLYPQHLLRETMGAKPRGPPTRAQHRATSCHTQCYQQEEHLRKSKKTKDSQKHQTKDFEYRTNQKYLKGGTVDFFMRRMLLITEEMGKFHNCQTLACPCILNVSCFMLSHLLLM